MTALYGNSREKFFELYIHENQQENTSPRVANIISKAQELNIKIKFQKQNKLDHLASKIKHYNNSKTQNIILKCIPKKYIPVENIEQVEQIVQQFKQNIAQSSENQGNQENQQNQTQFQNNIQKENNQTQSQNQNENKNQKENTYNQNQNQKDNNQCQKNQFQNQNQNQQGKTQLYVFLQGVTDPQNMGAILRSCWFLGVEAIIVENQPKAPLSAAVSKSSAGAMELMPIFSVKNLRQFLEEMEQKGEELQHENQNNLQNKKKQMHLLVTGIEDCNSKVQKNLEEIEKQEQENQRKAKKYVELSELEIENLEDLKRVGIVLGSEGFGVSQEILDIADNVISIDKNKFTNDQIPKNKIPYNLVDSLNVSAASSIFIHKVQEIIHQKK